MADDNQALVKEARRLGLDEGFVAHADVMRCCIDVVRRRCRHDTIDHAARKPDVGLDPGLQRRIHFTGKSKHGISHTIAVLGQVIAGNDSQRSAVTVPPLPEGKKTPCFSNFR